MIMSYIRNQYSTDIITRDISDDAIEAVLENPKRGIEKEMLPQWQAISLKAESDGRRRQDNYDMVHAIFLDYDGHLFIHKFMELNQHWAYLYTTSSHTEEVHKFRVIVPLVEPIPWSVYHHPATKAFLTDLYNIEDTTCFCNWHKTPTTPRDGVSMYKYGIYREPRLGLLPHNGDIGRQLASAIVAYDARIAEKATARKIRRKTYKSSIVGNQRYKIKVRQSIEAKLNSIPSNRTGHRYRDLQTSVANASLVEYPGGGYIFDKYEFEGLLPRYLLDDKVRKLIDDLFSKNQKII